MADGAIPDAALLDAAAAPDAMMPDAATLDAALPDAMPPDAMPPDAAPDAAPPRQVTLTVAPAGNGVGVVSASGIDCGTDCSESFVVGSSIVLTPTPTLGARFVGWTGACSGIAACTLLLDDDRTVGARFEQVHLWSRSFGDLESQRDLHLATDGAGNVYLTGAFQRSINFGPTSATRLTAAGAMDWFVAKLDGAGNHVWSKRFGTASDDEVGQGIAVTSDGIVLLGQFGGSVNLGGQTLVSSGSNDIAVAKLDLDGNHLWSRRFGTAFLESGIGLAVDGAGNVFFTGYAGGDVDFGGGALGRTGNAYLAKLGPTGSHLWSRALNASRSVGYRLACDGSGAVYWTGFFEGSLDIGGGALVASGQDPFAIKLDGANGLVYSRSFRGSGPYDSGSLVLPLPDGRVLFGGIFDGIIDLGAAQLTSTANANGFLAVLDGTGATVKSRRLGDGTVHPDGAVVDMTGNLLLTGAFGDTARFGGVPLQSDSSHDSYLLALDPDLVTRWSVAFPHAGLDEGGAIARSSDGNVFVTGAFHTNPITLGGGALPNLGAWDAWLMKVSP